MRRFIFNKRASQFQFGIDVFGAKEAVVADTNKSRRQNMGKEAADKFQGRQSDLFVSSGPVIIPDPEGNLVMVCRQKPLVGYGHPMGIVAQI